VTEEQIENNRGKSRIRVRIEHVFGFMTQSMGGLYLRYIGKALNTAAIGLISIHFHIHFLTIISMKFIVPTF